MTESWLGRILDSHTVKEMQELHRSKGLDLCGENGEYHTMVLDAPYFEKTIEVAHFDKERTQNGYVMEPLDISLKPKRIA